MDSVVNEIVEYWLGDSVLGPEQAEARRAFWYKSTPQQDAEIERRFRASLDQALGDKLNTWEEFAEGTLALVILLDQFTRNVFRGSALAYSGDERAMQIACRAIDSKLDKSLSVTGRIFLYHPFHHSEKLAEQDRVLELLGTLRDESPAPWKDYVGARIDSFKSHRDIVAQFNRFPHRNALLGRESTAQELEYLQKSPNAFGQSTTSASAKAR